MIRCARTCAKLSVLGAIAPLAARAACNSHAQCCHLHSPLPFSAASIRFSNPLFSQSQPRSDVAAAAENAGKEGQAHAAADAASSDVLAVYVTVPDLEQGMVPSACFRAVPFCLATLAVLSMVLAHSSGDCTVTSPSVTSAVPLKRFFVLMMLVCSSRGLLCGQWSVWRHLFCLVRTN